jgi:predicted PurR-regulated permease PerM
VISSSLGEITNSSLFSNFDFSSTITKAVGYIVTYVQEFFSSIPSGAFNLFVVLFITYYLLVHHKTIFLTINEYLPLSLTRQNFLLKSIEKNLRVLFKGYFLTGIIQTLVALVGYLIFGVENILIVVFLTFLTSLIPYLGTPLVWVPIAFYYILSGDIFNGAGLLIYGMFVISMVDNFARPILMSDKDTIAPPLVFIGFMGGLIAFGIEGIILGPIIISITSILLKYLSENLETTVSDH